MSMRVKHVTRQWPDGEPASLAELRYDGARAVPRLVDGSHPVAAPAAVERRPRGVSVPAACVALVRGMPDYADHRDYED